MNYSYLIEPDNINNEPYIFVSYSRKDIDSVQKVLKILKDNCFRFWYDKGLKSGTEWAEELGEKIDQCDQFFALISPNSVQSKYVRKEIGMAIDKGKNILVLYLEDATLTSGLQLLLGIFRQYAKEISATRGILSLRYVKQRQTMCYIRSEMYLMSPLRIRMEVRKQSCYKATN